MDRYPRREFFAEVGRGMLVASVGLGTAFHALAPIPPNYHGPMTYAGLKAEGVPMLGWGAFLTVVLNFLILAFIIFLFVRSANRIMAKQAEAPAEPAAEPADVALLREIRDELRQRT